MDFSAAGRGHLAQCLRPVAASLEHRGPDGTRLAGDDTAVLGACRLVIRGPSGGAQPLVGVSGTIVVCNGEIDNHRELRSILATRGRDVAGVSDVEVLPALFEEFGAGFVSRLEGAFALAVWQPATRSLLLARDRAGERPLFFARWPGGVGFGSELSAMLRFPSISPQLDLPAVRQFLRRGHFVAPSTPYREIQKVGPGEIVVLTERSLARERYWRWGIVETTRFAPTLAEFDAILSSAVRKQTDNDVPYGLFLSGGLDSTLIASLAVTSGTRPPTGAFAVRFAEATYDEGPAARRVAERLGLALTEVWATADRFPAALDRLLATSGEPLADPAWVPTSLLAEEAAKTVRVALVGEGADEIFGGYPTYLGISVADRLAALPGGVVRAFLRAIRLAGPSDRKVSISFLLRRLAEGYDLRGLDRHRFWTAAIPDPILRRLGLADLALGSPEERGGDELLATAQRFDLETSLAEGLLTKADRAAMSSALELRAPFLDRAVLDYAARLPREERVRGLRTKVFLKRYALARLPAATVHARKRGLSVPISPWLRSSLRQYAEEALRSPHLETLGVDTRSVAALFAEHLDRRVDHGRALWTLVVLSRWLQWVADYRLGRETGTSRFELPVEVLGQSCHAAAPAEETRR